MAKKINYAEGDCFSVPLREGGFALGVVARMDAQGVVFGYFFGPKVDNVELLYPTSIEIDSHILKGQFGDLGLLNGDWKVIGEIPGWSRDSWIMPPCLRWEAGETKGILCTYDENTLEAIAEEEVLVSDIAVNDYPVDRLMGYGSVEIKLTKLLAAK